jgi:hypothetical protein
MEANKRFALQATQLKTVRSLLEMSGKSKRKRVILFSSLLKH